MKLDERIISEKMIGIEPRTPIVIKSKTCDELVKRLNWYSYTIDEKQINQWIQDYMKKHEYDKNKIRNAISCPLDSFKKTTASLCRMSSNGVDFVDEMSEVLMHRISKMCIIEAPEEKENVQVIAINVQDRIKSLAEQRMTTLQDIIDSWYSRENTKKITFSMYDFLQREQLSSHVCSHIRDMIKRSYLDEMQELVNGEDEQLEEAYYFLSKSRRKNIYSLLTSCIDDIERYIGNVKLSKPKAQRKKKPVSVEKQINSLKYQKEFTQLKIKSINPDQIVGAQQLWVFNTKLNQLTVYNALNNAGLSIKGTTLQNFDDKTSERRKIRKPNDILPKVLDGGKIVLKRIISDLTTKPIEVNGRLNDDIILLRALR